MKKWIWISFVVAAVLVLAAGGWAARAVSPRPAAG